MKAPSYFWKKVQIYHTRLRVSCSSLNQHLQPKYIIASVELLKVQTIYFIALHSISEPEARADTLCLRNNNPNSSNPAVWINVKKIAFGNKEHTIRIRKWEARFYWDSS